MKVNKIFHWLYFLMLLLPVFAIPIYAIYVRNENSTFAQEITVQENKVVDFNQLIPNGNFENNTLWYAINGDLTITDNYANYVVTNSVGFFDNAIRQQIQYQLIGHKMLLKCSINSSESLKCGLGISSASIYKDLLANEETQIEGINTVSTFYPYFSVGIETPPPSINTTLVIKNVQCFDLTQMFGSGNEPTVEQFNQWYPNDYYDYTLSDKQLLKDYDQTTYNDTDVGSQFTYTIYNSIDKYFNYDKVFNFGDLYDWLQLNFFNGNAPIGFFIFWHYLIYFLLTSLLWLLFDVLMYVPNLIHKWLDKAS